MNANCLRRIILTFLCSVLVFVSVSSAHAGTTRDLVVVMDVSASMAELFDTAKAEATQFISSAQIGDRITVITFGEKSNLLIRTRVTSSHTIGRVLSEVAELSPVEMKTNLPSALERGLKEMEQFYVEDPNAERTLMWLSDDKNNPPDLPNLITFSSLKEDQAKKMPDHNWFVFQKPIKTESAMPEMDWFMDWAKRNRMQLAVTVPSADLGTVILPETEKTFTVTFEPNSPGIWGTSFTVVAEAIDEEIGNYSASIPIRPPVIVCNDKKWDQIFRVSLPDRPGSYVCRVSFVLPSDKLLEISPPQLVLNTEIEIKPEERNKQMAEIQKTFDMNYQATIRNRTEQSSLFAKSLRSEMISDFKLAKDRRTLVFGPIVSGGQYRESANLTVGLDVPVESLFMRKNFDLPQGIQLEPLFRKEEDKVIVDLCLFVDETMVPEDGWEARGVISFDSKERPNTKILPSAIPIRFYTRPDLSSWGKQQLEMTPTYEVISKYSKQIKEVAILIGEVGGTLLLLWILIFLLKRYVFATTDLVGMLEIARNPTRHKIRYFNLHRLGKSKRRDWLTIGGNGKADIVLPHPTVAEMHAKIMTTKIDASVIVFIHPLNGNQVRVNEVNFTRQKELGDGDKITIGEFVFVYKRPEVYRETIVCFTNGMEIRGTLVSWDIDMPSFQFLPMNAPSINAKMTIKFSELKTVSFVRKSEGFSFDRLFGHSRPLGYPVEVFFKDGNMLQGYMMTETGEWTKRFYVLPKDSEEMALILVERGAVDNVFKREPFKESRLRRVLRLLPH